jgi:hypothetical protein
MEEKRGAYRGRRLRSGLTSERGVRVVLEHKEDHAAICKAEVYRKFGVVFWPVAQRVAIDTVPDNPDSGSFLSRFMV